jgi:hypothetical protein
LVLVAVVRQSLFAILLSAVAAAEIFNITPLPVQAVAVAVI